MEMLVIRTIMSYEFLGETTSYQTVRNIYSIFGSNVITLERILYMFTKFCKNFYLTCMSRVAQNQELIIKK